MEATAAMFAPTQNLLDWLSSTGLAVSLTVLGAILMARFVNWGGSKVTDRIDSNYMQGDASCGPRRPSTGIRWRR